MKAEQGENPMKAEAVKYMVAPKAQVRRYTFRIAEYVDPLDEMEAKLDRLNQPRDVSAEIHRLARDLMERRNCSYNEALASLQTTRPELFHAYGEKTTPRRRSHGGDPSAQLHERVLRLMESEPGLGYSAAGARVTRENPSLTRRWSNWTSCDGGR